MRGLLPVLRPEERTHSIHRPRRASKLRWFKSGEKKVSGGGGGHPKASSCEESPNKKSRNQFS